MKRLGNILFGLALFAGMIVSYTTGMVLMPVLMLPIMPFFMLAFLIGMTLGLGVLFGFCFAWLGVGFVGLITTGSTRWLKYVRINKAEDKFDKGLDILMAPTTWAFEHAIEPILDLFMDAGEYCRKRLILNGDFRDQ